MATASPLVEPVVKGVRLDLTIEEADLIFDILFRRVGGPSRRRRNAASGVRQALEDAGIQGEGAFDMSGIVTINQDRD